LPSWPRTLMDSGSLPMGVQTEKGEGEKERTRSHPANSVILVKRVESHTD
jgi:hypothetical protein